MANTWTSKNNEKHHGPYKVYNIVYMNAKIKI